MIGVLVPVRAGKTSCPVCNGQGRVWVPCQRCQRCRGAAKGCQICAGMGSVSVVCTLCKGSGTA